MFTNPNAFHCWTCLSQGLKVEESQWGLGTFLTEDVKAGDLLAGALCILVLQYPFFTLFLDVEYTGELIYEPTTESREFVLSFCHLCCISDLFPAQGCREVSRPKLCLWTKYYRINRQLVCGQRDTVHQSFTEAKGEFLPSSLVGQWRAPYWYLCRWVCR